MKKIIFYITLMLCSILHSCNNKPQLSYSEVTPIKFDFDKEMKSIHDVNLIKDVDIISLDCDEVIIGEIDKIIKFDTIIYLMDKNQNKSIYLYNIEGTFLRSISNYGSGPDEYAQLTDMFIDPIDSSLNILSRFDKKILKYDLRGEKLRLIKRMPKAFTSMNKMNESYSGYMGNYSEDFKKPYNLWLLSENLEPISNFFKIDKIWESRSHGSYYPFSKYKDKHYYTTLMDYNIYLISNDNVQIKYNFDLDKMEWPKDMDINKITEQERLVLYNNYIYGFFNFQETEQHLVTNFLYRGQYLMCVYQKKEKEANIVTLEPYSEKYFFPFGKIISFDENTIFALNESEHIYRMWKGKDEYNNFEEKFPTQVKNLREKFDIIREDGNPFLIMYSIN